MGRDVKNFSNREAKQIDDISEGEDTKVDGEGDINKQIGDMN